MNSDHVYYIEIISSEGLYPKVKLVNNRTVMGRHDSCAIRIGANDLHVSNRHAAVIIEGITAVIEDLQSTNGVFVNGKRVMKGPLNHGDVIRFGTKGPSLKFIIEKNEHAGKKLSPAVVGQNSFRESNTADYSSRSDQSQQFDSALFDVSPGSESREFSFSAGDDHTANAEDKRSDKQSPLDSSRIPSETTSHFDVSPTSEHVNRLKINQDSRIPVPESYKKRSIDDEYPSLQPIASETNRLFDLSPESERDEGHLSILSESDGNDEKTLTERNDSSELSHDISSNDNIFDISPGTDSVVINSSIPDVNSTVEITKRLKNNRMNTQDIGILIKDEKKRLKILHNDNLGEQQKHFITTVTNAYHSMKRTHFIVFGLVSIVLCTGLVWFAFRYFSYKKSFPKALILKKDINKYDGLLEKARNQKGIDSSEIRMLYKKLQSVQFQFDSVKARLEVKDRRKIYSDTVEYFLSQIMEELNQTNYSIPHHMLEQVKYHIGIFCGRQRKSTEKLMERKTRYFSQIQSIFRRKNIPTILAYVAMQESLLNPGARSPAGAVGMWQFMKNTGLRFNLIINDSVDERLDWKKATYAAADYFRSLLLLFGDGRGTLLAIAAYNAGEKKIKNALQNVEDPVRDRDFWYLYRTRTLLAEETREYVPQILARIVIDKHPELYGFGGTKQIN